MKRVDTLRALTLGCIGCLAALSLSAPAQSKKPAASPQSSALHSDSEAQPQFLAGETKAPGGKRIGFVDLQVNDHKKRVVEVLTQAGELSLQQRAQRIADRMKVTQTKDPSWWKRLSTGKVRGLWVVKTPKAPGGFLITADSGFAREWGISSEKLADALKRTIHDTFNPPTIAMRSLGDLRVQAVEMRIEGDNAYGQQDTTNAEADYQKSIKIAPGYIIPYLRLASLYVEQSQPEKARTILQQAQQQHPDAESQQQIAASLHSLPKP